MKTRFIVLLAISAILTLSFTFISATKISTPSPSLKQVNTGTLGGFVLEDKL